MTEQNLTIPEIKYILDNTPIALIQASLEKLETSLAQLRSLYRSQLFSEIEDQDLAMGDGNDSSLVHSIGKDLLEVKATLKTAIDRLDSSKTN